MCDEEDCVHLICILESSPVDSSASASACLEAKGSSCCAFLAGSGNLGSSLEPAALSAGKLMEMLASALTWEMVWKCRMFVSDYAERLSSRFGSPPRPLRFLRRLSVTNPLQLLSSKKIDDLNICALCVCALGCDADHECDGDLDALAAGRSLLGLNRELSSLLLLHRWVS